MPSVTLDSSPSLSSLHSGMQPDSFTFSDAFLSGECRCHYNHRSSSSLSTLSISKILPNFCPVKETQKTLVSLDECVCIFIPKLNCTSLDEHELFAHLHLYPLLSLFSSHITHFLPMLYFNVDPKMPVRVLTENNRAKAYKACTRYN